MSDGSSDSGGRPAQRPSSEGEVAGDAGKLSHIRVGPGGASKAVMVDVGAKAVTARSATARAAVRFPRGVLGDIVAGNGPKGAVVEVARVAGIMAAKRTGELIPMCHPLGLDLVEVDIEQSGEDTLEVVCTATCSGRTGVEMEAMTGASVAALTVYDMTKAVTKGITIEAVELLHKSGGKSGTWHKGDG